jgi:hypothetical protein
MPDRESDGERDEEEGKSERGRRDEERKGDLLLER